MKHLSRSLLIVIVCIVVALMMFPLRASSHEGGGGGGGNADGGGGGVGSGGEAMAISNASKAEEAKKRANEEVEKVERMLQEVESSGQAHVELTVPGTVTEFSGNGLSAPRAWTLQEKERFDKSRIRTTLPLPKGVW